MPLPYRVRATFKQPAKLKFSYWINRKAASEEAAFLWSNRDNKYKLHHQECGINGQQRNALESG